MKHGWKWLVLAAVFCAVICLQAGMACAQEEGGHRLTVTMAEDAGEVYVNVPASVIINAEGAAALQVTDERNNTYALSEYWQWHYPSESAWGLNHEHVEYVSMFPQAGDKTLTFRAYWAEDVVDGEELPWIEESITIHVLTLGEAGAPVISQAEPETGSVTRGEMLGVSVETGANAENYGLTVYSGPSDEGDYVYLIGGEGNGIAYIPTWTMEAGEYTIRVENQGPKYTASSAILHFTVEETDWTEPTGAVWTASNQTVQPGEPVTVGVYVPGAESIMLCAETDGEEDNYYGFQGSTGTYTMAFDFSGQPIFKVYDGDGPWGGTLLGTYTGVTVAEGEKVPAPVVTCGETMEEGGPLAYSIAPGEGAEAYEGLTYRVTLKTNETIRGWSYRGETEPGAYSFSWAKISESFYYQLGDTLILQVDAICPGYEAARTEKAIFITGAGRDPEFTISLEGGTDGADGARRIPVNTGITLRGSGVPEDAETIEYLNFGRWDQTSRDRLTNGFRTGYSDEPLLHKGVVARYRKDGVYYHSNVVYIDYYRNGVMPKPQMSFQAGGNSMTAARDEAVVIRIANIDDYAAYGPYVLYYGFSAESGWIDRGSLTTDENGLAALDTAGLEAGNEYTIQVFASGREGISSSYNDSLKLTLTEPTALSFRADKSTVYVGEAYLISGYVPGAIGTRIVENNGESYESPYGNVVNKTFTQEEAGTRTYRLEAMYPAEGTEEAQWTAAGAADVTVTVNSYGDLNELAEVTMPEGIRSGSGITLTLESETIESMDRVEVRILDRRENLMFRAEKKQAMGIVIPGTVPEDTSAYDDFYAWAGPGNPVFRPNEIYTIRIEYTKKGYVSGVAEQRYFAYYGEAGNWLTADGGLGPITKASGETVALSMNLPAGARTVRVRRTDGDWYSMAYGNESGSAEEYTYSLTCTGTGEGFLVAWYTMDENPGWSDEDWSRGYYSNLIPCSISCSHDTTKINYYWDESSTCILDPEDETKHLHSGRAHMLRECTICGDVVENLGYETFENKRESHRYGGYRTCRDCGYACPHSDIAREITTGYEWVSDTQHKYIEQAPEIYEDCPVCGNYVHLEPMYTETFEDHTDADGNGVCDVCGSSIQGNWTWRLHEGILMIEGSGAIPGFSSAEGTGWYKERGAIKEIQIPEGITSIGAYAFAGLTETTRISFRQATRPAIDPLAFSGSRVIGRYYTEPEEGAENTWTGTYGAAEIEWVYLPRENSISKGNLWYYANDNSWGEGWVYNDRTPIKVTRKQAEELTFRGRTVTLYDLPAAQADRDVYEQHWEIMTGLDFEAQGEGSYALTMPETVNNMVLGLDAAGWTLTVDASATGKYAFGMVMAGRGTLNMTATEIGGLFLRGFYSDGEATVPSNATIHANVREVHYYNSSNSQYRFDGTATVDGTIERGYEYGTATIRIPNLPAFTESNSIVSQFENVRQDAPIVLNGALNVSGASSFGTYTEQNCRLGYELTNNNGKDWWRLQIDPLAGDNAQPVHVSDVADLKADFSVEDIYWGEHTQVTLNRARPGQTVTLTVPEGIKCEFLSVMHSNAVINGSFYQMDVDDWHQEDGPFQVTLNGTVDHFNMHMDLKLCSMTLGAGAHIREGMLYRPLYDAVFFENVGAGTMMENGRLTILSHKRNQRIASLAPSEETLTAAAGLNAGEVAVMNITDASLSETEAEELSTLTTAEGGTADAVFDVSISAYDEANLTWIDEVTELNEPVTIQVKNLTGTTAYVARLHEGADGLEAEKLESEITGDVITFQSDLFSKYVLVRTGDKTFEKPEITVEYFLSDNSVLISFPWVDGADYHAIKICDKATGEKAYNWSEAIWADGGRPANKCMFQVNIIQGGQDRLMAAGEYTAEIILKGDGYTDSVFPVDFEVFGSLPNFAANRLPEGLTKIEEEAFAGIAMTVAEIPGQCTEIGKKAFDGSALKAVLVPAGVRTIGDEAFPADTVIFTTKGSEAQRWAEEKGYRYCLVIR